MAKTERLFYTTSGHCQVQGRGIWETEELPSGEKGLLQLGWAPEHFAHGTPSLSYTFFLNIIAITLPFLILLLFPVNCILSS